MSKSRMEIRRGPRKGIPSALWPDGLLAERVVEDDPESDWFSCGTVFAVLWSAIEGRFHGQFQPSLPNLDQPEIDVVFDSLTAIFCQFNREEVVPSNVLAHFFQRQASDDFRKMTGKPEAAAIEEPALCILRVDQFWSCDLSEAELSCEAMRRESDPDMKAFGRDKLRGWTFENVLKRMKVAQIKELPLEFERLPFHSSRS